LSFFLHPLQLRPSESTTVAAPKEIMELVARFEQQLEAYRSGQYKEAQLRLKFLNPFFKALGWDVDNEQGFAEAYKDVIHEDVIRVGGAVKAPDYCFRIGGTRKLFLEAKKPRVVIKDEPSPAYQLRRYAWSAKLPLSILSDFEEFAVYDCRVKPHKDDPASCARIFYCTFREYAARSSKAPSTSSPSPPRPRRARLRWTTISWPPLKAGALNWPATSPCATRA
jgi:hypothetical protein